MRRIIVALGIAFPIAVICATLYVAWMIHHGFSTRTPPGFVETELAGTMSDMAIPSRYNAIHLFRNQNGPLQSALPRVEDVDGVCCDEESSPGNRTS
jgi:hypothetical protein